MNTTRSFRKASKDTPGKTILPEMVFLVVGSLFGLVLLIVIPPFEVPDEPQHFYRAYQVSELGFFDLVGLNKDQSPPGMEYLAYGTLLPKSLASTVDSSGVARIRFRRDQKVQLDRIRPALGMSLDQADREYLPVAPYPPSGYIPQALGIALARIAGLSPLVLLYIGRLFALSAWVFLMYLAIKTTPLMKWSFALLALMPMTISLAPSHSVDSMTLGISFLVTAQLLSWAYNEKKSTISRRDVWILLLLLVALALCKAIYVLLVFLVLLVPLQKFGNKKRKLGTLTILLASSLASYLLWSLLVKAIIVPGPTISLVRHCVDPLPFPNVSPHGQVSFILSNPRAFLDVLANTFSVNGVLFLNSFVGLLGWLDTQLPEWLPYSYAGVLLLVSVVDCSHTRISPLARILFVSIFTMVGLISLVYIYIGVDSVGMNIIQGFQGRYLIPVAPVFFLVFHNARRKWRLLPRFGFLVGSFAVVTLGITGYTVIDRFYTPLTHNIDAIVSSQEGDFVIVRGWAVDRTSDTLAAAVYVDINAIAFQAQYGIDRSDVAQYLEKPTYWHSGFEARIPINQIGRGQHTLALRIVTRSNAAYIAQELKLEIK